jgi:hypothetical protein
MDAVNIHPGATGASTFKQKALHPPTERQEKEKEKKAKQGIRIST